jgi:hypothetical protein
MRCQYESLLRGMRFVRARPQGDWTAGAAADSSARPLLGAVDVPPADSAAGLSLSGWVLDPLATGSTGIDSVNVYLGASADNAQLLGQATLGQSRLDVAGRFGNTDWSSPGFVIDLPPGSLPAGLTTLTLAAHSPDRGTWVTTAQVVTPDLGSAAAPPPVAEASEAQKEPPRPVEVLGPRLQVDAPRAGASIGRTALVQGVAFDPGVDQVEVFLEPDRDRGGRLIGSASLRQSTPARFSVSINVPPGQHTLYVHARSTVTNRELVVPIPVATST